MYAVEKLVEMKDQSNQSIKKMESALADLNAIIAAKEADKTRSREHVIAAVKAARDAALPAMAASLKTVNALAKESDSQKKFWESKTLLLSMQSFSLDKGKDAMLRMSLSAEVSHYPLVLLRLGYDNALADDDLPRLWQFYLAAMSRSAEVGFGDTVGALTLEGIMIPDQAVALAAISVCWSNQSLGEAMFSAAAALRNDPTRQLQVGREQQVTSRLVEAADAVTAEDAAAS